MSVATSYPRRLLVSPDGVAHHPNCRKVPATAESRQWGEISAVPQAIIQLLDGGVAETFRRGQLPGPDALRLCDCTAQFL